MPIHESSWQPVYREAEAPYTRSGRVLNPAPGGWCPTRTVNGRTENFDRYRPYVSEQACQSVCDTLNERQGP
jgi:hypothetical protein